MNTRLSPPCSSTTVALKRSLVRARNPGGTPTRLLPRSLVNDFQPAGSPPAAAVVVGALVVPGASVVELACPVVSLARVPAPPAASVRRRPTGG